MWGWTHAGNNSARLCQGFTIGVNAKDAIQMGLFVRRDSGICLLINVYKNGLWSQISELRTMKWRAAVKGGEEAQTVSATGLP